MRILNIAAGKQQPLLNDTGQTRSIVNVDKSYYGGIRPEDIESIVESWERSELNKNTNVNYYLKSDVFEFMERTRLKFDIVCVYRFLEHVPFDQVLYFIYLLSTVTKKGGIVDVIVPNYSFLATMLLNERVEDNFFEENNILLTTEMLNDPSNPHASIWTIARVYKFFELEKRFEIDYLVDRFNLDGRDVYIRFQAKRKNKNGTKQPPIIPN